MTEAVPSRITQAQYDYLRAGISPDRVRQSQGQSHVEAWDVRRTLIRIFGFGGFDIESRYETLIKEIEHPPGTLTTKKWVNGKQQDVPNDTIRWTVVYRVGLRLVVKDAHGREVTHVDDSATGDSVNQPSLGDAHDMALKTAHSQALKRCAVNLGDQFGLSLYNKGNAGAVVVRSLVAPDVQDVAPTPTDAPKVEGGELDEAVDRTEPEGQVIGRGVGPVDPQARAQARRTVAGPEQGNGSVAMAVAVRAAECNDVDVILGDYRKADSGGLLGVDVSKALHADLLDVVGIEPGGVVTLGAWLTKAGTWVRTAGGLTVTEKAKLDAEVPA